METIFTNLTWPETLRAVAAILVVGAGMVTIYYFIRKSAISNLVKRYEFMSDREIPFFKASSILIAIAVAMVFNSFIANLFNTSFTIGAGIFLSMIVGFIVGYSMFAYFDVYYPFVLEKRLMKLRFTPRLNPKTGKPLRLLNEHEEDVHMTSEMLKHERTFAYDYDIWIDEETGFKLVERYDGHLHALMCDDCNFRTLKDYREEILKSPTYEEKGVLVKHFKCSNCGHMEKREVFIAPLQAEFETAPIQQF